MKRTDEELNRMLLSGLIGNRTEIFQRSPHFHNMVCTLAQLLPLLLDGYVLWCDKEGKETEGKIKEMMETISKTVLLPSMGEGFGLDA